MSALALLCFAIGLGAGAGLLARAFSAWFFQGHLRALLVSFVFRRRLAAMSVSRDALLDLTMTQLSQHLVALDRPKWLCRLLGCQWCCSFHFATWATAIHCALLFFAFPEILCHWTSLPFFLFLTWSVAVGTLVTLLTFSRS